MKKKSRGAKRVVKPRFGKKYKPGMKPKRKPAPKAKKPKAGFKTHNMRVTASSKKHTWRTPQKLIDIIEKVAGKIGLDPCADVSPKHHFAKTNWTGYNLRTKKGIDGLRNSWIGYGVVYSNPPYGRGSIIKWIKKAIADFLTMRGGDDPPLLNCNKSDHCFLLVPARPDTKWFQEFVLPFATAWCFWKGRLKFSKADPAPFPSLIIYFGHKPKRFTKIFRKFGWVCRQKVSK